MLSSSQFWGPDCMDDDVALRTSPTSSANMAVGILMGTSIPMKRTLVEKSLLGGISLPRNPLHSAQPVRALLSRLMGGNYRRSGSVDSEARTIRFCCCVSIGMLDKSIWLTAWNRFSSTLAIPWARSFGEGLSAIRIDVVLCGDSGSGSVRT